MEVVRICTDLSVLFRILTDRWFLEGRETCFFFRLTRKQVFFCQLIFDFWRACVSYFIPPRPCRTELYIEPMCTVSSTVIYSYHYFITFWKTFSLKNRGRFFEWNKLGREGDFRSYGTCSSTFLTTQARLAHVVNRSPVYLRLLPLEFAFHFVVYAASSKK